MSTPPIVSAVVDAACSRYRLKRPVAIRINPLDLEWIKGFTGVPLEEPASTMCGLPVIPDDSVERGAPVPHYQEAA
jgi:hypothetical protein